MTTATLALLTAVDRLYEGVVTEPTAWHDQAVADWAEDVATAGLTRDQARVIRRCLRTASRLRDFWESADRTVPADDWRSRVDVALGPPAWRPTLDLALSGLEAEPSVELFEEAARRFRVVHGEPWLDGIAYDTWLKRNRTPGKRPPLR